MRREFNRPLVIWPSLATATIIALMWITSPGNPFAERFSIPTADIAVKSATTPWTPEGARQAIRRLEDSLRRSWDDETHSPWAGVEPAERPERGSRGMKMPARIAEAFGIEEAETTDSQPMDLPAPVLDEHRELAGMANPVARQPVFKLRHPSTNLWMPSWTIDGRNTFQSNTGGLVGEAGANSVSAAQSASNNLSPVATDSDGVGADETLGFDHPGGLNAPAQVAISNGNTENQRASDSGRMMIPEEDIPSILELFQVAQNGLAISLQDSSDANARSQRSAPDASTDSSITGSAIPESVRNLGRLKTEHSENSNYVGDDQASEYDVDQRFEVGIPGGWPITAELDQQLARLSILAVNQGGQRNGNSSGYIGDLVSADVRGRDSDSNSVAKIGTWSEQVAVSLRQLRSLQRIGAPTARDILDDLDQLALDGRRDAELVTNRETQIEWLRAAHGLNRRVEIWQSVWNIASGSATDSLSITSHTPDDVQAAITGIRDEIRGTGDEAGWSRFLMLDEIELASTTADANQRMVIAQRLLSRLHWHKLSDEQRRWMRRESIARLSESVRPWASTVIDYSQLVAQLERQESGSVDLAGINIADAVQTLRYSSSSEANRLSDTINSYYRNANVRLAISGELLKRFLPEIDPQMVPLRTEMLGSQVRGYSNIASNLDLQLVPAANCWSIQLRTLGNVHTDSVGTKSGVAVRTAGMAMFDAATPITVLPNRVVINDTTVDVQSQNQLRGIQSDYDSWPLIGSLVRSIAASRYEDMQDQATRMSNDKVRNQVAQEIDTRVDEQLKQSVARFGQTVLGPLGKLKLDPMVIDMETTSDRLLARYRLAGDWQLAAFTPRPRAPITSLLSVQMHQSAINNTLEQLVPRDEPQTIAEAIHNGAELFGFSLAESTNDIPADVTIQFAETRPITVEIEDGQVWVTLRVVRLARGENLDLRRFIVRAAYVPHIEGVKASLVREGHLRISGPSLSMRERLPVRAIFNKVLSPNRSIPIVLPQLSDSPAAVGLVVSQLELRDGWLALAISKAENARVALITPRIDESASSDTSRH